MTLAEVKLYLKVDVTTEDTLIQSLMTAAAAYIQQQTGKTLKLVADVETDIATDELYTLCLKMLITHWYDNRGPEIAGAVIARIDHSVDALINHISMCGDYL